MTTGPKKQQGSYLWCAKAVLMRVGSPMHYESITKYAIDVGLLDTEGQTPEIAMSSILSGDIRSNPRSPFRKTGAGVYSLRDDVGIGGDHDFTPGLLGLAVRLREALAAPSDEWVLKKAQFLLRLVLEALRHVPVARVIGQRGDVRLALHDLADLASSLDGNASLKELSRLPNGLTVSADLRRAMSAERHHHRDHG